MRRRCVVAEGIVCAFLTTVNINFESVYTFFTVKYTQQSITMLERSERKEGKIMKGERNEKSSLLWDIKKGKIFFFFVLKRTGKSKGFKSLSLFSVHFVAVVFIVWP